MKKRRNPTVAKKAVFRRSFRFFGKYKRNDKTKIKRTKSEVILIKTPIPKSRPKRKAFLRVTNSLFNK
ncbi:MAG TPA: hypothetical protein ENI18_06960 [Candidatus Aminicenantes bacterium]|nr:hypothetical protein [Candidatus Aminicenantes bacterium]